MCDTHTMQTLLTLLATIASVMVTVGTIVGLAEIRRAPIAEETENGLRIIEEPEAEEDVGLYALRRR